MKSGSHWRSDVSFCPAVMNKVCSCFLRDLSMSARVSIDIFVHFGVFLLPSAISVCSLVSQLLYINTGSATSSLDLGPLDLLRNDPLRKSAQWENEARPVKSKFSRGPSESVPLLSRVVVSRSGLSPADRRQEKRFSKGYGDPPLSASAVSETGRGSRENAALTSWQQRMEAAGDSG